MSTPAAPIGYRVLTAPDTSKTTLPGAIERLEQSRRVLRQRLFELNGSQGASAESGTASGKPSMWLDALKSVPLVGDLVGALSSWWAHHPLRAVADLFSAARPAQAKPDSGERGLTTVVAAVALGAVLLWLRPWRFALVRRAVFAGLLPQVISTVMSSLRTDGLIGWVESLLKRPKPSAPVQPPKPETRVVPPPATWNHGSAPVSSLH